ncbi:hypothetical protein ACOSQ2_023159 [Xanthoceras sorbifolium]
MLFCKGSLSQVQFEALCVVLWRIWFLHNSSVLDQLPVIQVAFVPRLCNAVVHDLARFSLSLVEPLHWLEDYPFCVATLVKAEASPSKVCYYRSPLLRVHPCNIFGRELQPVQQMTCSQEDPSVSPFGSISFYKYFQTYAQEDCPNPHPQCSKYPKQKAHSPDSSHQCRPIYLQQQEKPSYTGPSSPGQTKSGTPLGTIVLPSYWAILFSAMHPSLETYDCQEL